ncbi:hypothetical protein PLICRDRAFT_41870 [Plicaturopsis crispa FD-325 SS-3]|nr:hypothetical protein PLICRDRAFT_41870 [Plicaturopsis crispa FD-325 SS-3]
MPRCTRNGCRQEYDAAANTAESCSYHSGGPVFHEGLKSWSCCSDVNKPVMEFDQFTNIPGCTKGTHTDEKPQVEAPKPSPNETLTVAEVVGGKEVYTSGNGGISAKSPPAASAISATPKPAPIVEEEEDLDVTVKPGTTCRHKGCGVAFVSDEINRKGDGEGTVCTYHPAPPIFREGSKGYLCCKRRVLEFDEFLKIKGCKTGRHIFAPKVTEPTTEEFTECRVDHYQTREEVHVSVFAKQADKDKSSVEISDTHVHFNLYLPGSKRFKRTLELFGPVDSAASSFKYFGTKVEVLLKKQDGRSWTVLEKTDKSLGNISLTFGVGGRTGTIGGKEIIIEGGTSKVGTS